LARAVTTAAGKAAWCESHAVLGVKLEELAYHPPGTSFGEDKVQIRKPLEPPAEDQLAAPPREEQIRLVAPERGCCRPVLGGLGWPHRDGVPVYRQGELLARRPERV